MANPENQSPESQVEPPAEVISRLYDQFDSNLKAFRISLAVLLTVSILFFYMVLEPIIRMQLHRADKLKYISEHTQAADSAAQGMQVLATTDSLMALTLAQLQNTPQALVNELSVLLQGNATKLEGFGGLAALISPCDAAHNKNQNPDLPWIRCQAGVFLNHYFDVKVRTQQQLLIDQVKKLPVEYGAQINTSLMLSGTDSLRKETEALISDQQNYLSASSVDAMRLAIGLLYQDPLPYFRDDVESVHAMIEPRLEKHLEEQEELQEELANLQEEENEIQERVKEIKFPFFEMPGDMSTFMQLYPLIVTIGLLVCIYLCISVIRLRKVIVKLHLEKALPPDYHSYSLPSFPDPGKKLSAQIPGLLLFAIPVFFFLTSGYFTLHYWNILAELPEMETVNGNTVRILYGVCALGIAGAVIGLFRNLRK
jgi:hypothetical protein